MLKTSGKLFIATLHGDPERKKVPYLKKNAKHGLAKKPVGETRGDCIVYRIIIS
jgi:hypothetical protein